MILLLHSLMLDIGRADHFYGGHDQNAQIEKKALPFKVLAVQ